MGFFGGGGSGGGYPPVTSSTGAVQVGFSGGDALGTDAVNIQPNRTNSNEVASGTRAVAIGSRARATNNDAIAIGLQSLAQGSDSICMGRSARSTTFHTAAVAIGNNCVVNSYAVGIGNAAQTTGQNSVCISCNGDGMTTSANNAVLIGNLGSYFDNALRGSVFFLPFRSLYWSGTTTNATATILNLDGTATNRFTIAANTAVIANLYIIARRTDTVDKWFSGQRKVAIRRNNANGTAIIGSVETIGADQTEGSPTWSVAITADDTNEALQVEVTGAASETVSWRVMAFYHVV
jgi:hypothetical protein